MGLVVCSKCARHVRGRDEACPFCGATNRRLSRGAMFGAAAIMVSCHGASVDKADSGTATVTVYGGPPIGSGSDDGGR
jgi:hypothetical protein